MPNIPTIKISSHLLPFADGTDIVEVDMPAQFSRLSIHLGDGGIRVSVIAGEQAKTRCERFHRYTDGQSITGLDSLNLVLGTIPSYIGTVVQDGTVWHIFHEPTPAVPGMDDLLRRYATMPNVPPTASGGTTSA